VELIARKSYTGSMIELKKDGSCSYDLALKYGDEIIITVEKAAPDLVVGLSIRIVGFIEYLSHWPGERADREDLVSLIAEDQLHLRIYPDKPTKKKQPYYFPDCGFLKLSYAAGKNNRYFNISSYPSSMHTEAIGSKIRFCCKDGFTQGNDSDEYALVFTVEKPQINQ